VSAFQKADVFVEGGVTHFTSCATFPQSALRKGGATGKVRHATLNITRQHSPHRESSLAASEGRGAKTGGGKKPAETAPVLLLELVDIYRG